MESLFQLAVRTGRPGGFVLIFLASLTAILTIRVKQTHIRRVLVGVFLVLVILLAAVFEG